MCNINIADKISLCIVAKNIVTIHCNCDESPAYLTTLLDAANSAAAPASE